jgi:excisionase family DNA binding protein
MECYLDIKGVCALTKMKEPTIRKYITSDLIPYVRVGRLIRFRPSQIEAWLLVYLWADMKKTIQADTGATQGSGFNKERGKTYPAFRRVEERQDNSSCKGCHIPRRPLRGKPPFNMPLAGQRRAVVCVARNIVTATDKNCRRFKLFA